MAEPLSYVPCQAWATLAQWCCPASNSPITSPCPTPPGPPPTPIFGQQELIDMASEMLYGATGWLFPGICTYTVEYPQQCDPCRGDAFSGMYGFNGGGYPYPSFDNVRQNNLGPCCRQCDPCRCLPSPITHYPVASVLEIIEDGVPLDLVAAHVEVRDYNHITRCDGKGWDACKTRVTFTAGRTPPALGQLACVQLACALDAACNPDPCGPSGYVTGFQAAGRTYQLADLREAFQQGTLPIASVQMLMVQYAGARKTPYIGQVWTPELRRRSPRLITFTA